MVSMTDPDAAWAVKSGPATLGYYDNYLVDTTSRVILSVAATPARFRQEVLAAQQMIENVSRLGIRPQNLAADKAYGSGEFLAWLLERDIQPHIPVIDRKHQTRGRFTRDAFRFEPNDNAYSVRKENRCTIEDSGAVAKAISIARRKRNAKVVHKRSYVPRVPIGDCLFIGRNRRDKQFGHWPIRLIISVHNESATRSKLYSPS
jgi:hypothetical protein